MGEKHTYGIGLYKAYIANIANRGIEAENVYIRSNTCLESWRGSTFTELDRFDMFQLLFGDTSWLNLGKMGTSLVSSLRGHN